LEWIGTKLKKKLIESFKVKQINTEIKTIMIVHSKKNNNDAVGDKLVIASKFKISY